MNYSDSPIAPDSLVEIYCQLGTAMQEVSAAVESGSPDLLTTAARLDLYDAAIGSFTNNQWFTKNNVAQALRNLGLMLNEADIAQWLLKYSLWLQSQKVSTGGAVARNVLVIMAGNIPLTGMHDMLCVLAAGHHFQGKLSSQDSLLPVAVAKLLIEIEPSYEKRISFTEGVAKSFDAVIATGSSNSSRYFESYFGKYPHIIRKGRTSVSIVSGKESHAEIVALGEDIFLYYGLGCRNISMIWLPVSVDVQHVVNAWDGYKHVLDNQKYANNYLFNKAIFLVNKTPHTDTGFCLLTENPQLFSPVSVIHYLRYDDIEIPMTFIVEHQDTIQCVTASTSLCGNNNAITPLGRAQQPKIGDYADGVDTMDFLLSL